MNGKPLKILVSGTGIAGSAAAIFLRRDGHELTLIDRAPAFQKLGYGLSLKNFGLSVIEALGLRGALEQHAIPVSTMQVFEADGSLIKEFLAGPALQGAEGATAISRGDLHGILYEEASRTNPVRFGTTIRSLAQDGAGAQVTFSDGTTSTFDLVVAAEGLRSTTRGLLWKDEGYEPLDVIYAAAGVPNDGIVPPGVVQLYMGTGRNFYVIPVDEKRALIQCYFRTTQPPANHGEAVELMRRSVSGFAPNLVTFIERISAESYVFFDRIGMIKLPSLSKQRVVLLGDAGYCPTFLSGMGASLGLIGALALARGLREHPDDVAAGLAQLDRQMIPLTRHFQANAADHVETLLTLSPAKLFLRETFMHLMPQSLLGRSFGKQFGKESALVEEILGSKRGTEAPAGNQPRPEERG